MLRRSTLAIPLLTLAASLAACSSGATLSRADVEDQVSTQLTKEVGQKPDKVTCPGDLDGKVGTTMTCVLTAGSDTIDTHLKVTKVDGSTVHFSIQVADHVN